MLPCPLSPLSGQPKHRLSRVRPFTPITCGVGNIFGHTFRISTFGESHGPALGAIVDGCPPGLALDSADMQPDLDRRKPGTSRFTTQRRESDEVRILSGVFEGVTTGTPIGLLIENEDQRSRDYADGCEDA